MATRLPLGGATSMPGPSPLASWASATNRFSRRIGSVPSSDAAGAFALARRVAGTPQRTDERRRVEDELEGLLVFAAADQRHVPVGLDAGRAGERAWRAAGALDDRLLRHGLRERDVGRAPRHEVGVELVGHGHGAGGLAQRAAGAGRLVDVARLAA